MAYFTICLIQNQEIMAEEICSKKGLYSIISVLYINTDAMGSRTMDLWKKL